MITLDVFTSKVSLLGLELRLKVKLERGEKLCFSHEGHGGCA